LIRLFVRLLCIGLLRERRAKRIERKRLGLVPRFDQYLQTTRPCTFPKREQLAERQDRLIKRHPYAAQSQMTVLDSRLGVAERERYGREGAPERLPVSPAAALPPKKEGK
jgi:hypothetical protein